MAKQIVVIDPGHNKAVLPAKQSPDGSLHEYAWNFEMAERLQKLLTSYGVDARLTITKEFSENSKTKDPLTARANFANKLCDQYGSSNVMFVSIHLNAGNPQNTTKVKKDKYGYWLTARGWSVFVAANKDGKITGSKYSQDLANKMFDAVAAEGFKMRKPSPSQKFWPGNFTVLTATKCKAILMENLFQDNLEDCELLKQESTKIKLLNAWVNGIFNAMGEKVPEKQVICPCCGQIVPPELVKNMKC